MSPRVGGGRPLRGLYRVLLHLYPRRFRRRFAQDMLADYERLAGDARYGSVAGRIRLWWRLLRDLSRASVREHARRDRPATPGGAGLGRGGLPTDVRLAARGLLSRPGFTAVVVLTLAVGLGPTIGAYSLANWLLLRPLPGVANQEELGAIWYGVPVEHGISVRRLTYANLEDMVPRLRTLSGLGGLQRGSAVAVFGDGDAELLSMGFVDAAFFSTLGLDPVAGRLFTAAEDDPANHGAPVAVISDRLARARFGGPEAAVGTSLRVNGRELRILGVLPAGFHGPERQNEVDLWLPASTMFWVRHLDAAAAADERDGGTGFYEFVARLAPGASWGQVEAELAGLNQWLAETWPEANEGFRENRFLVYPGIGSPPLGRNLLVRTLRLIAAVVGCILLVACANVSNLLLMRSLDRRGEIAVHKALGAATSRLVRRTLVETSLLCGAGAAAGLVLARGLLRLYEGTHLSGLFQPIGGIPMDCSVAGFAAGACVVVALVASVLPSLGNARVDPARWLAEGALTSSEGGRAWRAILGAMQLTAALPLLIGALLFGQTLRQLSHVELGFDPDHVRLLTVEPSDVGYGPEEQFAYFGQLLEELSTAPGIRAVTFASNAPLVGGNRYTRIRPDDASGDADVLQPLENEVGADYFEMLDIPLLQGRTFTADETLRGARETTDLVVLSASLAERLFGTTRAVGRTVHFAFSLRQDRPFRVIGVVDDVHSADLVGEPEPIAYTPLGTDGAPPRGLVLVQGPGPGDRLERAAIEAARRVDPLLPLVPIARAPSLEAAVAMHLSERVLLARLFTTLSAAALLLAGIGLYGTVGRSVIARTREIGIRKALGADARRTLAWTVRKALAPVMAGMGVGCLLGLYGVRFIESQLHGVRGLDPLTWIGALLILGLTSLLAAALPARRAVRLDPARALRAER